MARKYWWALRNEEANLPGDKRLATAPNLTSRNNRSDTKIVTWDLCPKKSIQFYRKVLSVVVFLSVLTFFLLGVLLLNMVVFQNCCTYPTCVAGNASYICTVVGLLILLKFTLTPCLSPLGNWRSLQANPKRSRQPRAWSRWNEMHPIVFLSPTKPPTKNLRAPARPPTKRGCGKESSCLNKHRRNFAHHRWCGVRDRPRLCQAEGEFSMRLCSHLISLWLEERGPVSRHGCAGRTCYTQKCSQNSH